jgi:hypothetical protein
LEKPLDDGTQYTAKEQHDILLIVKIVMLALDRAARTPGAEGNQSPFSIGLPQSTR